MPRDPALDAQGFAARLAGQAGPVDGNVSRETLARLSLYLDRLRQWQKAINLVGPATLDDPWRRHMLDSAQLLPLIDREGGVIDLGSGAGFPGLVLAMLGVPDVHLIESDQRKATFLREVARETGTTVTITAQRIEAAAVQKPHVTARALAALPALLQHAARCLVPGGKALFLKGASWEAEVTAARQDWQFEHTVLPSWSDPAGVVLTLEALHHV